jgi:DNA-binding NarL/FixJ family response regulator
MNKIDIYTDNIIYGHALRDFLSATLGNHITYRVSRATRRGYLAVNGQMQMSLSYPYPEGQKVASFLAAVLDHGGKSNMPGNPLDILTRREREVLAYLARGETNKTIARTLDLQVVTVKLHVRSICRKLNVSNRTQAALIARENLVE